MTSQWFKNTLLRLVERYRIGNVDKLYDTIRKSNDLNTFSSDLLSQLLKSAESETIYYSNENNGLVTKKQIQNNREQFISSGFHPGRYVNSSGGSTGSPVSFLQDREYRSWCRATEKYYFQNFLGIDYDRTPKVVLWGSERDALRQRDISGQIYNWITNTLFLNSFKISDQIMAEYVNTINAVRPVFIKGYAGSLYELAKFIEINKLQLPNLRFAYSAAEQLRPEMRKQIEKVFNCKVFDFYGSREVGPIAGECEFGSMHIFSFNNLVRIFDFKKNKEVQNNAEGRIIVTNLHNYSMPLIQYEIGDTGVLSGQKCKCGSELPVLKQISGRITDHFVSSNDGLIHGEFFTHLFYHRPWIKQFQVVQEKRHLVKILFVPSGQVDQGQKKEIEEKMHKLLGTSCKIVWIKKNSIETTSQGKYLYTKSLLQH
jgi:phenylacetate-CoA ligase